MTIDYLTRILRDGFVEEASYLCPEARTNMLDETSFEIKIEDQFFKVKIWNIETSTVQSLSKDQSSPQIEDEASLKSSPPTLNI